MVKSPKIHNAKGITLSELLISAVIVGIVMLGVVSADFAIQKFYRDSSSGAVSGFNAIAMLNNISNTAYRATGSFTNSSGISDPGILVDTSIATANGASGVGAKTFCIRTTDNPPWQCYYRDDDGYLYYCSKNSATICTLSDTKVRLERLTSMSASFVSNTNVGSQSCIFTISLTVPDTDSTTKTYTAKISPPNHRL